MTSAWEFAPKPSEIDSLARSLALSTKGMASGITVACSEASAAPSGISRISGGKKTFSDNLKAESAGIPAASRA